MCEQHCWSHEPSNQANSLDWINFNLFYCSSQVIASFLQCNFFCISLLDFNLSVWNVSTQQFLSSRWHKESKTMIKQRILIINKIRIVGSNEVHLNLKMRCLLRNFQLITQNDFKYKCKHKHIETININKSCKYFCKLQWTARFFCLP